MKTRLTILLASLLLLVLQACETDFDLTADYKDITIVYGIISQNDSVHFLRINKAFLGDGNALEYAKVEDSMSYGKKIDVKIIEFDQYGNEQRTFIFDTTRVNTIDSGLFSYPSRIMYKTNAVLDPANNYKLLITNKESGKTVTSETALCRDFEIVEPSSFAKNIGFKRSITSQRSFKWNSGKNGKRHQLVLHFHFKEKSDGQDTIMRIVDWVFPEQITKTTEGGESVVAGYKNESFYTMCKNFIPYSDAAKEELVHARIAVKAVLEITVTGSDFSTYVDVNGPSEGLLTEKPLYTNISNGLGVFSSSFRKYLALKIDDATKVDLYNSNATLNMKFAEPQHN